MEGTLICIDCGAVKKRRRGQRCMSCSRKHSRKMNAIAYTERYKNDPEFRAAQQKRLKEYQTSPEGKAKHRQAVRAHWSGIPIEQRRAKRKALGTEYVRIARQKTDAKYPEKARARAVVQQAIKAGSLVKDSCMICGAVAEAHHADYSMPLQVMWMCKVHHRAWERVFGGAYYERQLA